MRIFAHHLSYSDDGGATWGVLNDHTRPFQGARMFAKVLAALRNNPVRVYSTLTALITAAAAFGFNLSGDQQAALLGLAAVLLGGGEAVRAQVTGPKTTATLKAKAAHKKAPPV